MDSYYPFGGSHKGYNNVINGVHNPSGFGGKEEQDELGLQWLDFGARNYDAALGRWMNLDPLADQMRIHTLHIIMLLITLCFSLTQMEWPQDPGDLFKTKNNISDLALQSKFFP